MCSAYMGMMAESGRALAALPLLLVLLTLLTDWEEIRGPATLTTGQNGCPNGSVPRDRALVTGECRAEIGTPAAVVRGGKSYRRSAPAAQA